MCIRDSKKPPEKDPKTIQIPIAMKDLLLSGSSLLQIARKLNEQGYRTKHGNLLDARGVRYVLENPFYTGISRWNYTDLFPFNKSFDSFSLFFFHFSIGLSIIARLEDQP